jgi:hypothetical protein
VIDTNVALGKESMGEDAPDAVPVVTTVETVPGSPVKTVSSLRSSGTRRKPVPPPKDETTLPSWITQVKKPRRRPVSVASVCLPFRLCHSASSPFPFPFRRSANYPQP